MAWVGAIMEAAQKQQQGMASWGQERGNEAVAIQNAALSREEAKRSRQEAGLAEEAHRRVIRQELGAAFAASAQSGARGGGGTSADRMLKQSATLAELDALNIRYGGELEAGAHAMDAANFDYEAKAARARAKAARTSVIYGTAGSMLSGAAAYGTSMQNTRLRGAERDARNPGYSYGGKKTAAPGKAKPQASVKGRRA